MIGVTCIIMICGDMEARVTDRSGKDEDGEGRLGHGDECIAIYRHREMEQYGSDKVGKGKRYREGKLRIGREMN